LLMGRMQPHDRVIALTVGAIVCVAAANAGNTSQDLKTGFLVGATPRHQQVALLVGALTSALVIGWTLDFLNRSAINILPVNYPGFTVPADSIKGTYADNPPAPDGKTYRYAQFAVEVEADGGKTRVAAGKYLVGEDNRIHYLVNPGVGGIRQGLTATLPPEVRGKSYSDQLSTGVAARGLDDQLYQRINVKGESNEYTLLVDAAGTPKYSVEEFTGKLDAPKAALMGVLVDGVLTQKLPWALILIGAVISLMLEIIGVQALPVAVGIYLPISTSATIFAGGLIRSLVQKLKPKREDNHQESLAEEETGKGVLLSSGLIAGGAIGGLLIAGSRAIYGWMNSVPTSIAEERIGIGAHWWITSGSWSNIIGLLIFGCLAYFVFNVARKRAA
ncbi:MAG: OPT/YSL family transporter, partial [Blastocatellia bacterium]